jgi:hypothetical protein
MLQKTFRLFHDAIPNHEEVFLEEDDVAASFAMSTAVSTRCRRRARSAGELLMPSPRNPATRRRASLMTRCLWPGVMRAKSVVRSAAPELGVHIFRLAPEQHRLNRHPTT